MNKLSYVLLAAAVMAALLVAFVVVDNRWLHWRASDDGASVDQSVVIDTPTADGIDRTQTNAPAPSAVSRDAFAALWLASQQATYRARYKTSSETGEEGDGFIVFNRPPAARIDTIAVGSNDPSSQIFVGSDGTTVACSFDGGERSCGQIAPFSGALPLSAGPFLFPAAASFPSLSVAELDARTIAGSPARCFTVTSPGSDYAADYCFSADAVPVYGTGPFGLVEASELSTVTDADLVVPKP